jgi:hypothetical protein
LREYESREDFQVRHCCNSAGLLIIFAMPANPPLTASGPRDPEKQPRPMPKHVKDAIVLMVRGRPDDPDGKPLDFIEAAKRCGLKPDQMRKWLDRSECRSFLRAERKAWREAICAGNESALQRVRDGDNAMASVRAVQVLERLDEEQEARSHGQVLAPGLVIQIVSDANVTTPTAPLIDVPVPASEPERAEASESHLPIFRHPLFDR